MDKNRPLSPHLQIYAPQITSVLSILHRFTGVSLSILYFGLCSWVFLCVWLPSTARVIEPFFGMLWVKIIGWGFAFSLIYHLLNGARHLVWDMGHWFSITATKRSGYWVVALSLLGTAAFIYYGGLY